MTPTRVAAVLAVFFAAGAGLAGYRAVLAADGRAQAVAAVAAAALGVLLALPRSPLRRSVVVPLAAVGAAILVVRSQREGAPAAVFGIFGGYFAATSVRVARRAYRLASHA